MPQRLPESPAARTLGNGSVRQRRSAGDPSDWPPGTWADSEIKAYVPSTYDVTFGRVGGPPLGDEVLAVLPAAVQELLRDRTWGENANGSAVFWGAGSIPTDDIRTLIDILDDAGVERRPQPGSAAHQTHWSTDSTTPQARQRSTS